MGISSADTLTSPSVFERVACDLCGSQDESFLFNVEESPDTRQPPAWRGTASIPVVRCQRCDLVYLNPRYNDERLTVLYQDPQMFRGTIDPDGQSRNISAERQERVRRFQLDVAALRQVRANGRLLDIGCGLGFFLEALGKDYSAVGLEWSSPVVEMMREHPFRVVEDRFPRHPFSSAEFDIVTFHNTFDHLPRPLEALRTVHSLLKPGGVLMLTSINFGGIAARVYGPGYRLLGPNHLYYFTPETLRRYFAKSGFRLLQISYPYFGTEFAKPWQHARKVAQDWWVLHVMKLNEKRLSPPFYGNMMRVFAVKEEAESS